MVTRRVTAQRSPVAFVKATMFGMSAQMSATMLLCAVILESGRRLRTRVCFRAKPAELNPPAPACHSGENVVVLPFGLSEVRGRLSFREEPDGTTSHIVSNRSLSDADETITVSVRTGDEVILSGEAAFPNTSKSTSRATSWKCCSGFLQH